MEVLARHTVDNRGITPSVEGEPSSVTHLPRAPVMGGGADGQVLRAHQRASRRPACPIDNAACRFSNPRRCSRHGATLAQLDVHSGTAPAEVGR